MSNNWVKQLCYYKINTLVIVPFCYKFIEYLSLEMNRNIKNKMSYGYQFYSDLRLISMYNE